MRVKIFLAALALCAAFLLKPVLFPGPELRVEIPEGSGASSTAALLAREQVISSPLAFKILAKVSGSEHRLIPGVYLLKKGMGSFESLRRIREGRSERAKIVIPEGFMAAQIALRLEASGVCPAQDFLKYVRANNLEGYLFPATYSLDQGLDAQEAAHRMHERFRRAVEPEFSSSPQKRFTLAQALALASIVQREARRSSEMPMIAAVYINRLNRRMRLQADPTVQYALGRESGEWKKELSRADLKLFSKYNTYEYYGLPPGPICSPGLEAFQAVLSPAQTDAIYFVADNAGGHIFSRTNEEHSAARIRIRRETRRSKRQ
ncbi:MAG: endolytic transglycosylase MltG [Elusimicrobiota bacterium]|jgi:UPF0755 protein